jgi:hypothetical protein
MRTRYPTCMALLIGAALGATLGLAPTAHAFPSRVTLQDVTFSDGGTASGFFTLNVSGYLANPTSVTTTAGSVLPGTSYSLSGPSSNDATHVDFTIFDPPASHAYQEGLNLIFEFPLGSVEQDPIIGGCEYTSYSCIGPAFRTITGGLGVIPEPMTLTLLGGGLLALSVARPRRSSRGA